MITQDRAPALLWSWSHALLGLLYAAPAVTVMFVDPTQAIALAVGVLPAAAVGLPGPRRGRAAIVVLGLLCGVSMVVGSVLALVPVLAVPAIFALAVGAALLAPRGPLGRVGLTLCLPLIGIGLSFDGIGSAAGAAGLMALGSVYACAVSLVWPAGPGRPAAHRGRATTKSLDYGVRLGLAAAIAAGIGFWLGLDHVGWATAAVLLVMRPAPDMVRSRGFDRVVCILLGAGLASAVIVLDPGAGVLAVTVAAALTALAGTRGSRRYVTSAFTTYLVFLLLLYGSPQDAEFRFVERVAETVLGVALALAFGVLVPRLRDRHALSAGGPDDG